MVFGRHPHTPLTLSNGVTTVHSDNTPLYMNDFIKNWHMDLATAHASMETAQKQQQRYANQHRRDVSYVPGHLNRWHQDQDSHGKFKQRWIGPWPVTHRTGAVTYRIRLPQELCCLHPVFHVSKLKQHLTSDLNPAIVAPDVSLNLDDVASIQSRRSWKAGYLIRWDLPYGPESDSWEAAENLEECDTFLAKQDS
jgi:hypothetical protein